MSTTNREKRKQAKRKARERAKKKASGVERAWGGAQAPTTVAQELVGGVEGWSMALRLLREEGIHARPSVLVYKALRRRENLDAALGLESDKEFLTPVPAGEFRPLTLAHMSARLGIRGGDTVTLNAQGPDSRIALEAVREALERTVPHHEAVFSPDVERALLGEFGSWSKALKSL